MKPTMVDEFKDGMVSPFVVKMIVDSSDKYKKAYKSYAFGLIKKLAAKWIYIVIGIVAAIVIILFVTGNLGGH